MDGRLRRLETALGRRSLRAELEAAAVEAAAMVNDGGTLDGFFGRNDGAAGLTADDILDELRAMAAAAVGLSPAEVEEHLMIGPGPTGGTPEERAAVAAWLSGNASTLVAALGTGGRA